MNIEQAAEILGGKFQILAPSFKSLLEKIDVKKGTTVLDIGTGDGKMAIALALKGFFVLTGEPRGDTSTYAKQNWHENASKVKVAQRIKFQHFSAENLPFDDEKFDFVSLYGSFHHFEHKKKAIQEILRVLKDRGKIILIEPNDQMMQKIRATHPDHPDADDPRKYLGDFAVKVDFYQFDKVNAFIIKKI